MFVGGGGLASGGPSHVPPSASGLPQCVLVAGPSCCEGRDGAALPGALPQELDEGGGGWSTLADSQIAVPSFDWFQVLLLFSWLPLLLPLLLRGLRGSFGDSSMSQGVSCRTWHLPQPSLLLMALRMKSSFVLSTGFVSRPWLAASAQLRCCCSTGGAAAPIGRGSWGAWFDCVEVGVPQDVGAGVSVGVSGAPHCEDDDDDDVLPPQLLGAGASLFVG